MTCPATTDGSIVPASSDDDPDSVPATGSSALCSSAGRLRCDSKIDVLTKPGHSTLTLMSACCNARSRASDSDSATTACLVTVYAPRNGGLVRPAADAVLTMWAWPPCSSMIGTNERTPLMTPHRFTPRTHFQSATVFCQ